MDSKDQHDVAEVTFKLGMFAGISLGAAAVCLAMGFYWTLIPCAMCYTAAVLTSAIKIHGSENSRNGI